MGGRKAMLGRNRWGVAVAVTLLFVTSGSAWAETIELVTYYPSSATTGDLHVTSLTVGTAYNGVTPPDGVAAIYDKLWIGQGYTNPDRDPAALRVVGYPGAADKVLFLPGAGGGSLNVGIGTANPRSPLDVSSTTSSSSGTATAVFQDTNGFAKQLYFAVGSRATGLWPLTTDTATTTIGASGANPMNLAFASGNAEMMRITSAGNVGIGTAMPNVMGANANSRILSISGDGSLANANGRLELINPRASRSLAAGNDPGRVAWTMSNNGGGGANSLIGEILTSLDGAGGANGFGGKIQFRTKTDNVNNSLATKMVLDQAGNVGVGTADPTVAASPSNNSANGNIDANDVWLRGANRWASQGGGPTFVTSAGLVSTTTSTGWQTRDISSLVPVGTRSIIVYVRLNGQVGAPGGSTSVLVRQDSSSPEYWIGDLWVSGAYAVTGCEATIPIANDRTFQYFVGVSGGIHVTLTLHAYQD